LNAATNAQITNIEAISAVNAIAGVTINLSNQTEAFTITGSNFADTLIGGSGNDTFIGFVGADYIDGGAGNDTLSLSATSADLNAAINTQLLNVESVTAANATAGVTIDLHNQTEGFTLTGSGFDDILTGSAGADTINTGGGNNTIIGFVGADKI